MEEETQKILLVSKHYLFLVLLCGRNCLTMHTIPLRKKNHPISGNSKAAQEECRVPGGFPPPSVSGPVPFALLWREFSFSLCIWVLKPSVSLYSIVATLPMCLTRAEKEQNQPGSSWCFINAVPCRYHRESRGWNSGCLQPALWY